MQQKSWEIVFCEPIHHPRDYYTYKSCDLIAEPKLLAKDPENFEQCYQMLTVLYIITKGNLSCALVYFHAVFIQWNTWLHGSRGHKEGCPVYIHC